MNDQETFDFICTFLHRQGKAARHDSSGYSCEYETADGLRCAVGCLLPPGVGRPLRGTVRKEHVIVAVRATGCTACIDMLADLQVAHDNAEDESFWLGFSRVAERIGLEHGLDVSVISRLSSAPAPASKALQ